MSMHLKLLATAALALSALAGRAAEGPAVKPTVVVAADDAPLAERLAAKEVRRYVYLRTGKVLPIAQHADGPAIVVGSKERPVVRSLLTGALGTAVAALGPEQYVIKTILHEGRTHLLVTGGDPVGTLYAAYRLAEHLGVRFYMHGDVVPDERIALEIPPVDETGKPLFDRRGIQPFHDFPEGPDWWNSGDYKAIIAQLPKMRMNFFGLHCYPEGSVGPEPLVWIGAPEDVNADGSVKFSYPSRHFITRNPQGAWGYRPTKTSDYSFGAAAMYERDDFGADYMRNTYPWMDMGVEESSALFDRMAGLLREVFTFARPLGVKSCIGTETPLTIPKKMKERLAALGKNPDDPAVVREVYAGMFRRIMAAHPLDYYWFWTPEGWTWEGTTQEQIDRTVADLRAAIAAAEQVRAPFTLATCGWVLGPPQDRALFDKILPPNMPVSCINRQVGHAPVEPGFADVEGRPQWAIPWLEDDPALNSPQLWAGRMRKDAADALRYGCTGLMGIHWRTRILAPNVSAMAKAAWDQAEWNPDLGAPARAASRPPEGPDGGQHARFVHPVENTDEIPLYQSVRYNVEAYYLDVPNGNYRVTLKFCEPHYEQVGQRVFGVRLQERPVIERLDIFEKVGHDKALDYTFADVAVTDGQLVIEFVPLVEFPSVAAIVVEGPAVRRINCGGPAWNDYQADWPPSEASGRNRFLPAEDFYVDWAGAEFGPSAAEPIGKLFARLDGHLPRPSDWVGGPGGIKPDPRPWEEVSKQYAFVEELASLHSTIRGAGNQERFEYWLNQFQAMRANAHVNCLWAAYNRAFEKVKTEPAAAARKRLARETALPLRKELVAKVGEVHRHLLAAVSTYGDMGNVTNWQQHVLPMLLGDPGVELAQALGEPLPADAMPASEYTGQPRLFVPTIRTTLTSGESLLIKVVVLGLAPQEAAVVWRPLGSGDFSRLPLEHVARGVYRVTLPSDVVCDDIEYYVEAKSGSTVLRFPATAPELCQTLVRVASE